MKFLTLSLSLLFAFHFSSAQDCRMSSEEIANALADVSGVEVVDSQVRVSYAAFTYEIPKENISVSPQGNQLLIRCTSASDCIRRDLFFNALVDSDESEISLDAKAGTDMACLAKAFNQLMGNDAQENTSSIYDKLLDFDNDEETPKNQEDQITDEDQKKLSQLNDRLALESELLDYRIKILETITPVPSECAKAMETLGQTIEASDDRAALKRILYSNLPTAESIYRKVNMAHNYSSQALDLANENGAGEDELLQWQKIESFLDTSMSSAKALQGSFPSKDNFDTMSKEDVTNWIILQATMIEGIMTYQTSAADLIKEKF